MSKKIKVVVAGQPNVGKSSLLNAISDAKLHTGNFSGVTVEKTIVEIKTDDYNIEMVDLPGIYSLNVYTPEEQVAKNYLLNEKYDVIINIVDANALSRNLMFSLQLLDMQKKMILIVNMVDEIDKKGGKIYKDKLETLLGIPVLLVSAKEGRGVDKIASEIIKSYNAPLPKNKIYYSERVELRIDRLSLALQKSPHFKNPLYARFIAIRLLDKDEDVYKIIHDLPIWIEIHEMLEKMYKQLDAEFDEDSTSDIFSNERVAITHNLEMEALDIPEIKETLSEKIDNILIHPLFGIPIFLFLMWGLFQTTFILGNIPMDWIDGFFSTVADYISSILPKGEFNSLLTQGVIPAVDAVVMFLPNILILFLGLNLLEQTGYMARAAYLMDGFLKKFGLQGKAFVPLVSGFGCTVPAYMAARTLKNPKDRIITMLVLGFMSCGARLPIYVLIISAFFPKHPGNVLFGIYIGGAFLGLIVAKILRIVLFKGEPEPFVMEIPPYRFPSFKSLFMDLWIKTKMFLKKAGTFIAGAAMIIWFLSTYPHHPNIIKTYENKIELATTQKQKNILHNELNANLLANSYLGDFGKFIEPVFKPLGFDWRMSVSVIAGLAAKETVVSTMGTLYAVGNNGSNKGLIKKVRKNIDFKAAIALIVIIMIYSPCIAAMSTFYAEVPQWIWRTFYTIYPNVLAWLLAYLVYNVLKIFGY